MDDSLAQTEESFAESYEDNESAKSEDEPTEMLGHENTSVAIRDDSFDSEEDEDLSLRDETPQPRLKIGRDWTEQLLNTISPVKNRLPIPGDETPTRHMGPRDIGPLDLMEQIYSGKKSYEV